MSTDRISSSSSLIEAMRLLARERVAGRSQRVPSAAVEPTENSAVTFNPVRQTSELRRRLHELANRVDLKDPQSVANLRVPVLREILLWEFGSDFRQDSQFLPMIESINQAFDIDPRFQQRFADMLAGLKKV